MARCPGCGEESHLDYCGYCGSKIPGDPHQTHEERMTTESRMGPEPAAQTKDVTTCVHCGSGLERGMSQCPTCGKNPGELWNEHASSRLVVGGIFAINAGALALLEGILIVVFGESDLSVIDVSDFVCLRGGINTVFGIGAVLGGVFAIDRRHFVLAALGAVVGMLGMGISLIGFLFGLNALILIAMSKKEFRD